MLRWVFAIGLGCLYARWIVAGDPAPKLWQIVMGAGFVILAFHEAAKKGPMTG